MHGADNVDALKPLIVVPTYNERENLPRIVSAILEVVPSIEILIVDDNSPDGTGQLADKLVESEPRLHVLHRAEKEGLGPAYVAGFKWALERHYDRVFEMDADFSHPPEYLPAMLEASLHHDVVIGSRYVPGGSTQNWGLARRLISKGGGLYARLILGVKIRDLTAGFICWRREVLETLPLSELHASGYAFQIELKYRSHLHKFRITELPIHFPDRTHGDSKMSPRIALEALWTVWAMRKNIR